MKRREERTQTFLFFLLLSDSCLLSPRGKDKRRKESKNRREERKMAGFS